MLRSELARRVMLTLTTLLLLPGCVSRQKYDALEARYQELALEISSHQMQMARLQDAIKVTVNDELLFPQGGWKIGAKARQTIATLVPILASMQQTIIIVNGYTDSMPIGPRLMRRGITSNLLLSQKRADNVMHFMISQGLDPNLVSAHGFGDAEPVASNDTAAGRAQNRRVELLVAGSEAQMLPDTLPLTTNVAPPRSSQYRRAVPANQE